MSRQRAFPQDTQNVFKMDAKNKRFFIASLLVHLLAAVVLFSSWKFSESVEVKHLPATIQARVLSAAELQQLKDKKLEEQRVQDQKRKKLEEQKRKEKKAREDKQREKERKKAEQKKREEAKKKAEAKRKEDARKKALIEKQKKEQQEKQKLEREKKNKAQQEKQQAEAKRKEEEQKRKEREELLEQRLREAEASIAEQERQREMEEVLSQQRAARAAKELEEKERFMVLIRNKIENRWHIPPKIRNQSVLLRIRLLPNGELSSVSVVERSESPALDQSAINAVQSVLKFPVPEDKAIFEQYFRQFTMRFSPER